MLSYIKRASCQNFLHVLIALNVLLYLALIFSPVKPRTFGDYDFHEEAKIIAKVIHGDEEYNKLSITKAPGPVLLYSIPYTITGSQATDEQYWTAGVIWIGLLTIISLSILYKKLAATYNYSTANIFMVFTFVIPLHIYYSLGILAESMAFLGVIWLIIGFLEFRNSSKGFYYVAGLLALVLARPNSALVIPLLIIGALYFAWILKQKEYYKYARYSLYATIGIVLVTLLVKSLPNTRQTKNQEQYLAFVMHHGRFQFRTETFDWRFWDNNTRADSKDYQMWLTSKHQLDSIVNAGGNKTVFYDWVLNDVVSHPLITAKQFFVRILFGNTLQISSKPPINYKVLGINGRILYWWIHIMLNITNIVILVFAIKWLLSSYNFKLYWPLYIIIIALCIFHGAVYMEQRYLFPARPIVLLFSALMLSRLLETNKNRDVTARNIINYSPI